MFLSVCKNNNNNENYVQAFFFLSTLSSLAFTYQQLWWYCQWQFLSGNRQRPTSQLSHFQGVLLWQTLHSRRPPLAIWATSARCWHGPLVLLGLLFRSTPGRCAASSSWKACLVTGLCCMLADWTLWITKELVTAISNMLEHSGGPPLGFMVDRICPYHLVRSVDATHVLVVLCNCCGSGDGDLLFCPILHLLPTQHCLHTVHQVDGGAQGDLSSIHQFDKQKIPVPDPPYAASRGSFSEGILLCGGDPSLPVGPTGSEPLLAQVCVEERTSVKIVCIDSSGWISVQRNFLSLRRMRCCILICVFTQ